MEQLNIHRVPSQPFIRHGQQAKTSPSLPQSFSEQLNQAMMPTQLKISKHASDRLRERKIQITEHEWTRIVDKVNEAKVKGIKESLVLLDQAALIVSVKNSTVITAMDRKEMKDQLFTNIDGTIILS